MPASPSTLHRKTLKEPFSADEIQSIRKELETVLASSHFRNSRRFPAFLTYIVEAALQGKSGEIKERSIGVEAFDRPVDYDTSLDPVVRMTAGEVRKRLTLYYGEQPNREARVEISLLSGSYVPEFTVHRLDEPAEADLLAPQSSSADSTTEKPVSEPHPQITAEHTGRPQKARLHSFRFWGILLLAVLASVVAGYWWWHANHPSHTLWTDFFSTRREVLIVVPEAPPPSEISDDWLLKNQASWTKEDTAVALDDLSAILPSANVLAEHQVPYNVKLAPLVTLADMRDRPVILVGGPTNQWTTLLTDSLRYRIKIDDLGIHTLSIGDSQKPHWAVCRYEITNSDNNVTLRNDCALIARFRSSVTGSSVMVIAGAGKDGTQAAGEWIASPDLDAKLSELFPDGWRNKNIEIVLKTMVIGGQSSAPTVVKAISW
jgi:hypothetical protein